MPGLYALGRHAALLEIATRLSPGDKLYAFLDDVYITTKPQRAPDGASQHCLAPNVQVHLGKTRAWNAAGEEPPELAAALPADPANPSWVGNWALPAERQDLVVLSSPVGNRAFVEATLDQMRGKHDELLQRLPELPHLQTAWLLLLYCAAPRCQYLLRMLPPAAAGGLRRHMMRRCSSGGEAPMTLPDQSRRRGQLPLRMGGMGLASAVAHRQAAYWASWADTVGALQAHHPDELEELMRHFLGGEVQARPPSVAAATWESLLHHPSTGNDCRGGGGVPAIILFFLNPAQK